MSLGFGGRKVGQLGIGHGVEVDARTGAAGLRVPVPVPAGRQGFGPQRLALTYASGAGNSAYGTGWSLAGLPTISLDTRLHLPRWDGSDGYALDGDELVPWLEAVAGVWTPRGYSDGEWSVAYLRSRRAGPQVRVEKWTERATGRVHFRTRDAHDVVTIFGARSDAAARIAEQGELRTFAWLPEVQLDPHGNAMWLEYAAETVDGVDLGAPWERLRSSLAQRYLKRIRYSNATPLALDANLLAGRLPDVRFCFQVVLDYGDHGPGEPGVDPTSPWPARVDPFSSSRCGFEVRTYRLCRRFLVFHELDLSGPMLVDALALIHDESPAGSTLGQIGRVGYRHDGGVVTSRAVPRLRMTYAPAATDPTFVDALVFTEATVDSRENVPVGLAGRSRFVDLLGEGLSGILTEGDRAWYYKPNRGNGAFGAETVVLERPATRPNTFELGDLDRDGDTELSQLAGRLAGLYALDREEETWSGFRPFQAFPHVEAMGLHAQWVDLNGDGRADIVVQRTDGFVWFASDGDSFLPPVEVPRPASAAAVPTLSNPALDFFFADMTGDGLADLVRVQNGRVEYWPSLGNCRFGDGVVMDGPSRFAPDGEFDTGRLRFVDLDGSGTADLVYLGQGEVTCWINACGNRLEAGLRLGGLPIFDNVSSVRVLDFLGDGRSCLVWSSPLPGRESPLEYLPLTPVVPPRLLLSVDNSLGQRTQLRYSSSASHYLRDQASGRGWSTRLPSHHPVVDRREVVDQIGNTRSVQRYAYHDGYYDGGERQQRGFAAVDVYDADAVDGTSPGSGAVAFAAPTLVRTWFHLGTPMWNHHRLGHTYAADTQLPALAPHVIDSAVMTADEIEDGLRALSGKLLRREVYATDEQGRPGAHPIEVFQASFRLRWLQPALGDTGAAFSTPALEDATWTYEAEAGDPRCSHHVVVETDAFDVPVREATIGYARRVGADLTAQSRSTIAVHDRRLVHLDEAGRFELGISVEDQRYELVGLRPARLYTRADLRSATAALRAPGSHEVELVDDPAVGPRARRLSWNQTYYWNGARDAALSLGQIGPLTLPHHQEAACFTAGFVADALDHRVDDMGLVGLGYRSHDGLWWQAGETHTFAPVDRFSQLATMVRPDGATTQIAYDDSSLAIVAVTDPLGNSTVAELDPHQLAPWRLTDANGNVSEVRYDALGVVISATRYGHAGAEAWGCLALGATPIPATLADALAHPEIYLDGAASHLAYDLDAWSLRGEPTAVLRLTREDLAHDGNGGGSVGGRIRTEVAYLDGLGRVLQEKTLVEPGDAIARDASGQVSVDGGGRPVLAPADPRWRASGHVVYDAKQRPGRAHDPFFSPTSGYEGDDALSQIGTPTITLYDAMGRVVREELPNGTHTEAMFHAWSVEKADPNDTARDAPLYRAARERLPARDPERMAYEAASACAGTTLVTFLDPLGREAGSLARGNSATADRRMETVLDVDGRPRQIIDPRGLVAFRYRGDMKGRLFYQDSVDAGVARSLPDAFDRVVQTWNGRGFEIERGYDLADRPLYTHVRGGDGVAMDHRVEDNVYGESLPDRDLARRNNFLGRLVTSRDSAGETSALRYDPVDHPLATTRRLRSDVDSEPNWLVATPLDAEVFSTSVVYDALGRPRHDMLADGSARTYEYLASGPLNRVRITTPDGVLVDQAIVDGVTCDAHGQRNSVAYGNGVAISYGYDADTHRLSSQTATSRTQRLQALRYTYDPVGNLVSLVDDAQQGASPVIRGATASARRDYGYDAHYRISTATGRVHQALLPAGVSLGSRQLSLNDGTAIEAFTQTYGYDSSGNLSYLRHAGTSQSWTTELWTSATSNRSLPRLDANGIAIVDPESQFDAAGNLRQLAHLRQMEWTYQGALGRAVVISRPGGTDDAERYVYGGDGLRVRKTTTRVVQGGKLEVTEKIYLGDAERKRVTLDGQLTFERWTTHVGDGQQRVALVHRWVKHNLVTHTDTTGSSHVRYQLNTHQGSSAFELDETGNVLSYEEYFPHGGTAFIAGDDATVAHKEYRYSAKECDSLTGLYAYGYRYYAPWMGRWLSPDPIGPVDDLNLYQFVLGNPASHVDENGLQSAPTTEMQPVRLPTVSGNWGGNMETLLPPAPPEQEQGVTVRGRRHPPHRRRPTPRHHAAAAAAQPTPTSPPAEATAAPAAATPPVPVPSQSAADSSSSPAPEGSSSPPATEPTAPSQPTTDSAVLAPPTAPAAPHSEGQPPTDTPMPLLLLGPPPPPPPLLLFDEPRAPSVSRSSTSDRVLGDAATGGPSLWRFLRLPRGGAGEFPQGTLYIWSGNGEGLAWREILRTERGWMMGAVPTFTHTEDATVVLNPSPTPEHEIAEAAHRPRGTPGFDFNENWGPPSATVVGQGTSAGSDVQSLGLPRRPDGAVSTYRGQTIQELYEWPAVRRGGYVWGGLSAFSGGLTIWSAGSIPNPYVRWTARGLGMAEIGGGVSFWAGSQLLSFGRARVFVPLMRYGGLTSRVAGPVAGGLFATYQATQDYHDQDWAGMAVHGVGALAFGVLALAGAGVAVPAVVVVAALAGVAMMFGFDIARIPGVARIFH